MSFIKELKRRNVIRVGVAYVLMGWVLLQGADFVLDLIGAPDSLIQGLTAIVVLGLPVALIVSWIYELTPDGVKRESELNRDHSITPQTGRKLDRVIIVFLLLAVGGLLADRFYGTSRPENPALANTEIAADSTQKSVAVLPFLALSSGDDDEYFADGLTEEILNALAQLPELLVTARTSVFHFKGKNLPTPEIAQALGVDHIVEGSVRRSGDRLRVTAQLIRASDGFHLWSENYDRDVADTLEVQSDIAEKIAAALDVLLDDNRRALMKEAGVRDVEAFIAFQKGLELYAAAHGSEDLLPKLREANHYFETATQRVPGFSQAYTAHADYYMHLLLDQANAHTGIDQYAREMSTALENAVSDYQKAIDAADQATDKQPLEIDLDLIQGNWKDLVPRMNRILDHSDCYPETWAYLLGATPDFIPKRNQQLRDYIACDPLRTANWNQLAGNQVWTGDHRGALETIALAETKIDHPWLRHWKFKALVQSGQFGQAATTINIEMTENAEQLFFGVRLLAAQGKEDEARSLLGRRNEISVSDDGETLRALAWLGDRDAANQLAGEIDARPIGPMALWITSYLCVCGAPFDLEATPNFAARWEELGLAWPLPSPINLPLKDW